MCLNKAVQIYMSSTKKPTFHALECSVHVVRQLMAERKFSNRPLQLEQLQNIICVFCYQIRLQKEHRIPRKHRGSNRTSLFN